MATKVSASASVNPLSDISSKQSGILRFALESSALDIGYGEYRAKDYRIGFSREVNKAYRVGMETNSHVVFESLTGNALYNPLDDFGDQATDRTYTGLDNTSLDFMPLAEILSDENPDGVAKRDLSHPDRVRSEAVMKAMNLSLEDMHKSLVGSEAIPQMGTAEWSSYNKAYRASGSTKTEAAYRNELISDREDKNDAMKDVTDISVGYFGTFNDKATIMPLAMYHTFLDCLGKTSSFSGLTQDTPAVPQVGSPGDPNFVPGTPAVPGVMIGKARIFRLHSELYSATYTMNGYMLREVVGVIEGNTKKTRGYSKTSVHLEADLPLSVSHGATIHSDFANQSELYTTKAEWEDPAKALRIPDSYIKIQVQVNATTYRELIMVDLYQETTIEGKGETRRSNSGNQDANQQEMTWEEAYIAESFIPLTKSSMMEVRLFERGNLLIECKCHFIQMVNITKLKWYQTGIFKAFMVIVSVVIFIYSGGLAGGIVNVLYNMAVQLAIQYALTYLIEVLVELGIISSTIASVLIVAAAMYGLNNMAGITMDFKSVVTILNLSEATGKVFAGQMVLESEEHNAKMAEIQEEKDRLEAKEDSLPDMHISSAIGRLSADLQRMVDVVNIPLMESREEFMYRTTTRHVITEPLTYKALKYQLMNLV